MSITSCRREYWPFHPAWLEYVKREWKGLGRVEQDKSSSPEITEFKLASAHAFDRAGVKFKTVKAYLSVQVPKEGEGYDEQYPHTHEPPDATTLIHYLQPGDKPAPLDVFHEGVIETIYPKPGLTVFMPNHILHGVRINQGTTNRIQLIATALK